MMGGAVGWVEERESREGGGEEQEDSEASTWKSTRPLRIRAASSCSRRFVVRM
jgi:hypothetical protein